MIFCGRHPSCFRGRSRKFKRGGGGPAEVSGADPGSLKGGGPAEFSSKRGSPTTYLGAICIANKTKSSQKKKRGGGGGGGGEGGPDPLDTPLDLLL